MEHYSDFGFTNNPQVGLIWRPFPDLKARATYGTSFRAPLLNDLNPVPFEVVPLPEPDPTTGRRDEYPGVFGGNPDLKPEKARIWTAGLDFTPQAAAGVPCQCNVLRHQIHGRRRPIRNSVLTSRTF